MSIVDSTIAPYLTILVIVAILVGFFRKLLIKVVATFLVMVVLLAIFPRLLVGFVNMVTTVHGFLF